MVLRSLGCGEVRPEHHGTKHLFSGWVHALRVKGSIAFLELRDGTGRVQFVLPKKRMEEESPGLFARITGLSPESAVAVEGLVQASDKAAAGHEVVPTRLLEANPAGTPLPLALWDSKVSTGLDTRLDHRFLDLRSPRSRAIMRVRNAVLEAGATHLRSRGFVEVHTSNINAASSEGGTEVFPLDYFGRKCFLAQSPQLYKQMLMASGLDRVFEVGWYFRAEKHDTVRHLNESTAFDFEMAWIEDEDEVMAEIEGLLHAVWSHVADRCKEELEVLGANVSAPERPFPRVPYEEALEKINAHDDGRLEKPLEFGDDIGTVAEAILGRVMHDAGHDFYFITKWPLAAKPFYVMPEDGTQESRLSRAFDLDYRGVELTSGAQRVHQPEMLAEGIKRWGMDPKHFESYLEAFRYGMPPHGGCGIGIERILMQMLNLPNIREAILFPRDTHRVVP